MTETAITTQTDAQLLEQVVIQGDLSRLTPEQKLDYYRRVCDSMGLNPLTRPFDYIKLNGRLVLYAKRDAADQLRKLHGISIDKPDVQFADDLVIVAVTGRDKTGRTDSDLGVVSVGNQRGDAKANAILKAITKAKRRLTLSIVGLGWLDETEIESIPSAEVVTIADVPNGNGHEPDEPPSVDVPPLSWKELYDRAQTQLGYDHTNHVKNTMIQLCGQDFKDQSFEALWAILVDHKRAPAPEPA
jgi:hypothetical protein